MEAETVEIAKRRKYSGKEITKAFSIATVVRTVWY